MSITSGTTFGHYTIIEAIGAGGMSEVFRALDTGVRIATANRPSTLRYGRLTSADSGSTCGIERLPYLLAASASLTSFFRPGR